MLRYYRRNDEPTPFERPEGMPEPLYRLLVARGIDSPEAAEAFLHPDERSLVDPFLLNDMSAAVERIRRAMEAGERICVYGDYDVDGVCASAIMKLWLEGRGADVEVYLPSRQTEGYGLNESAVREIARRAKLMVTVDCGVTSVELVALAKSLGMDVIVTDHHRPIEGEGGFTLPDCPVVNPLLKGYPFPCLCGAGVAWKLVWALSGALPEDCVDIAALATVADVVSLTGENRAIVAMGLRHINERPRAGVAALIEAAGLSGKPIQSSTVAFQLAPRLNAGGRLETAMLPLQLVTCEDPEEAAALAGELDAINAQRRRVEQEIQDQAEAQLQGFDFISHRALILAGKGWNPGVIGLVASRLVEKYHYPVVMLSDQGDRMTGSCRSIEGVDIHAALTGCADTLVKFGGHRQAAGLTLESKRLHEFIDAMDRWLRANVPPEAWIPAMAYDAEIGFQDIDESLVHALDALQPTGFGNPAPVFRATAEVVEARSVGLNEAHLKLTLSQDGHRLAGIAFREGWRAGRLGGQVDALFVPKLNTYMGRTSAQLEVRALEQPDAMARIRSKLDDEAGLHCDFLTEILYNNRIDLLKAAPSMEPIGVDELSAWMSSSPQGTLVIAGDLATAARLMRKLSDNSPDLYFGELPEDPRAFNALCVCPPMGEVPEGYRRIVLCGAPGEWLNAAPGIAAFRLEDDPGWVRCLPDLDDMRSVYRALMSIQRRPVRFMDLRQLAHLAADEAGTETLTALAALLAILDMGLFRADLDAMPARITRLDKRKVEPEESPVWRAIQRWRGGEL